jgi:iron(III) transport system ATP-binding protein
MASMASEPYLQVIQATKRFGSFTAVDAVSFAAQTGELICVLGPSGCGKTTLLRIVAGLENRDSGQVIIQGRDVSGLPVSRRHVGIVFQNYALFPNLSAADNIAYGLKSRRADSGHIRHRVAELLELVGLKGMDAKFPAQLSGGQQQRVALARAMALSPSLLLLDEPLSALDAKVRIALRAEIRQLQQRLGVTTIMVTHDQEEALTMADRILVMDRGRLVQSGTPSEVYDRPASPFVAAFIGMMNFIPRAIKTGRGVYSAGGLALRVDGDSLCGHVDPGTPVTMAIRPEDVLITPESGDKGLNRISARVQAMEYRGPLFRLRLALAVPDGHGPTIDADLSAEKVRRLNIRHAMTLPVILPMDRIRVYPPASPAC